MCHSEGEAFTLVMYYRAILLKHIHKNNNVLSKMVAMKMWFTHTHSGKSQSPVEEGEKDRKEK